MIREITNLLAEVYQRDEGRAIAHIIAEEATGLTLAEILLRGLNLDDVPKAKEMVERALQNEPIQHIIGWTMFCGNRIKCDRRALIPRPETEEMVMWIIQNEKNNNLNIIDIGTGSGCIAVALGRRWNVSAMEFSDKAIELANENFSANNVNIDLVKDNVLNPSLVYGMFDVIVSNPPYIKPSEKASMEANVLDFEPELALYTNEDDPLIFYKAIADFGRYHLNNSGRFYVEINRAFGSETADVFKHYGYKDVKIRKDMFGNDRFVSGIWTK